MTQALILAAVFVGTVGLLVGVYVFVNRRELASAASARERLRMNIAVDEKPLILREDSASQVPLLNALLAGRAFVPSLERKLQLAGSRAKAGTFILSILVSALAGALFGQFVWGAVGFVVWAVIGALLPFAWLARKRKKFVKAFEAQLPDAIDMLVSAMRAGYSFQAGMRFIGDEMSAPLGPEFARFYDEQRLGVEVRAALLAMQQRVDSLDLTMLVTAVLIQRESGGTLAEVLSNIADLMRQRVAVRGQIETLTSEPKMSARFLAALPLIVFIGLSLLDPPFMKPMTTTLPGKIMLGTSVVLVIVGYMILSKLADVDF